LHALSILALLIGFACTLIIIAIAVTRHPSTMSGELVADQSRDQG
jgi:hypothetical protein